MIEMIRVQHTDYIKAQYTTSNVNNVKTYFKMFIIRTYQNLNWNKPNSSYDLSVEVHCN